MRLEAPRRRKRRKALHLSAKRSLSSLSCRCRVVVGVGGVKWSKYATILEYASSLRSAGRKRILWLLVQVTKKRRQPCDGCFLLLAVLERHMLVRPFSFSLFYPIPRYIELKQNPNLSCARYLAMVPQTFLCVRLLLGKDK